MRVTLDQRVIAVSDWERSSISSGSASPSRRGPHSAEFPRGRVTSVYFRDPDGSLLEFISYS
jgi:catechol 2,3-dioxygenase-like lactoylglutathione lyase family enzyme